MTRESVRRYLENMALALTGAMMVQLGVLPGLKAAGYAVVIVTLIVIAALIPRDADSPSCPNNPGNK